MTREELAIAANQHIWESTGKEAALDASAIARYERGLIRWPGAQYRDALRAILGASTDEELGFQPTRRGSTAVTAVAEPPAAETLAYQPTLDGRPADFLSFAPRAGAGKVGWPEVEFVKETTRVIAASENRFGGGLASELATAQLRLAAELLEAPATVEVKRELAQAIGNLAGVVAFAAYDVSDHTTADRCFEFALWCADEAGSGSLRACTLADVARKTAQLGRPDRALEIIDTAMATKADPRSRQVLPAVEQAMLSAARARYLAQTDRTQDALTEVARADDWFAQRTAQDVPAWLAYYDSAEHQGSVGKTLLPIAMSGTQTEAVVAHLSYAVEQHTPDYVRSRTFSRVRMATLLMAVGETEQGLTVGTQALHESAGLRSDRLIRELGALAEASLKNGTSTAADFGRDVIAFGRRP